MRNTLHLPLLLLLALMTGGCTMYANIPSQPGDVASNDPNAENVLTVVSEALRVAVADRPPAGAFNVVLPPGTLSTSYRAVVPQLGEAATWNPANAAVADAAAADDDAADDDEVAGDDEVAADEVAEADEADEAEAEVEVEVGAVEVVEPVEVPEVVRSDLPVVEVRQVRIRGWRAQVDVIRPADRAGKQQELVTVHLRRYPIGGWGATQLYLWRIPVEQALRESVRTSDIEAPPAGMSREER